MARLFLSWQLTSTMITVASGDGIFSYLELLPSIFCMELSTCSAENGLGNKLVITILVVEKKGPITAFKGFVIFVLALSAILPGIVTKFAQ